MQWKYDWWSWRWLDIETWHFKMNIILSFYLHINLKLCKHNENQHKFLECFFNEDSFYLHKSCSFSIKLVDKAKPSLMKKMTMNNGSQVKIILLLRLNYVQWEMNKTKSSWSQLLQSTYRFLQITIIQIACSLLLNLQ
jgi:hypothetical protein